MKNAILVVGGLIALAICGGFMSMVENPAYLMMPFCMSIFVTTFGIMRLSNEDRGDEDEDEDDEEIPETKRLAP